MALTADQRRYLEARRKLAEGAGTVFARLSEAVRLGNVLEVGCGDGSVLAAAREAGARRVVGVERFAVPAEALRIPPDCLRVSDYAETGVFDGGGGHHLVVCLELADSLAQPQLSAFLDALVRHGRMILFSGRIPGQDGEARSPGLFLGDWERAFRRRGFRMLDFFRPRHWSDNSLPHWARQNLALFYRGTLPAPEGEPAAGQPPAPPPLPTAVHPFFYDRILRRAQALEAENAALRQASAVPLRKLAALDEALLAADETLVARIEGSIREHHLPEGGDPRVLSAICSHNDLMSAAYHLLQPALAAEKPGRQTLRTAARLAESIGAPERAWQHLEAAGDVAAPSAYLAQLALRLGRRDWLREMLARPGLPQEVANFAPFLELDAPPPGAPTPPIHVVNLPTDRYRRLRAARSLAALGLEPRFRRGYRPIEIPPEGRALFRIQRLDLATDGSYGHQYAEYVLWREIAAGDAPVVMTMEDDSLLLAHPAAVLAQLELPEGWDIIFANPRLDLGAKEPTGRRGFSVLPFTDAFIRHSHLSPGQRGFGLDSVILSREGARKLAAIAEAEGFYAVGTDWWVQSHCVDPDRLGEFAPDSRIRAELSGRFGRPDFVRTPLQAYALTPAITYAFALGIDRRRRI